MLQKKNRLVTFVWPEAQYKKHLRTPLSDDWKCSFDEAPTFQRSLTIKDTGDDGEILNESTIFVSPKAKTEPRFKGVRCFAVDKDEQVDYQITYEFFLFEDQIYVLEDTSYLEGFVLMKLASKNPKRDWRWLKNTLESDTYLITYTGPDLDEESAILCVFSTLAECFDWMRNLARKNGISKKLLVYDSIVYEEIMLDNYNIAYIDLDELKSDPYGCFRNPDETSFRALVNNDFSRITEERWKQLEKRIKFPKVEYTPEEEDELVEIHIEGEKLSQKYME